MASAPPTNIDARGNIITNIGRDQNYNTSNTFNIAIHTGSISRASLQQIIQTVASASNVAAPSSRLRVQIQSTHQQAMVAADDASGLIVAIVHLLVNRAETSDAYRDLKRFLGLFNHTILMTRLALQTFEYTPLGPNLANAIKPEILGSLENLRYLFDKLADYRERLNLSSVRDLWSRVLWSGSEFQELYSIRDKLYQHQVALREFLAAVNSISWKDLGDELRNGAIPLQQLRASLRHGPLRLQHIHLCQVVVIDHLGSRIPVPTMFCSTWRDFNYIIKGYCKGRVGAHFVEDGDFRLITSDETQEIKPGIDDVTVLDARPGSVFEMSITLYDPSQVGKCPRCHRKNLACYVNSNRWVECQACAGKFTVYEMETEMDFARCDEAAESDVAGAPSTSGNGEEGITSSSDKDVMGEERDEICFFRRIQVIYYANVGRSRSDRVKAIGFLEIVKAQLTPDVYKQLLVILTDYEYQGTDHYDLFERVSRPLEGYPSLFQKFREFLSDGHSSEEEMLADASKWKGTTENTQAIGFVETVKAQFIHRPAAYNYFLDILQDFTSQRIDTSEVIERVSTLFQEYPSLIHGFHQFLPEGYRIEMSVDKSERNVITVTTPRGKGAPITLHPPARTLARR